MNYEIVTLPEKKAAGITARTNNHAPDMGSVIGGLWESFYAKGVYDSIPADRRGCVLGIYSDYESDENGDYDMTAACEVADDTGLPENLRIRTIPAGRYAKFVVRGDVQQALVQFWMELWSMNLNRTFQADFEEYHGMTGEEAEIHVYIGLNNRRGNDEYGIQTGYIGEYRRRAYLLCHIG